MNLKLKTTDFELNGNAQLLAPCDRCACAYPKPEIKNPKSPRHGMTLIELLIVITILTTLVAGVIPLLSPNNDERKITTASRSFQTYINLAKAKAARTGRPHGIAIVESSPGSGVALEVFGLEVPPPFAGFSTASAVRLDRNVVTGELFVQFLLADGLITTGTPLPSVPDEYELDFLPPNFLSFGDYIIIDGVRYRFTDSEVGNVDSNTGYYVAANRLQVEHVEEVSLTYAFVKKYFTPLPLNEEHHLTALKRYQIQRQPANSSEAPFQFPAGVGVDMQASVTTGDSTVPPSSYVRPRFPSNLSLSTARPSGTTDSDYIGIMFSPSGSVSSVSLNGTVLENAVRIAMLIARVENAGLSTTASKWTIAGNATDDSLEELQKEINWLNLDSRILSLVVNNGRAVVSETAFVDARKYGSLNEKQQVNQQINAAYEFAREMSTAK